MAIPSTNTIEISGVLIPAQWDKRGNMIQMAIQTNTFERYLVEIEHDAEILQFVDQSVRANGSIVGEDVVGQRIIKITKIEKLTRFEPDSQEQE